MGRVSAPTLLLLLLLLQHMRTEGLGVLLAELLANNVAVEQRHDDDVVA